MAISSIKIFDADQRKTIQSNLHQVIDIIQEDLSGSATRRKYETFVSGSGVSSLTSSLYQTVYDQDFTYQTANPVLDMTIGLFHNSSRENLVTHAKSYSENTTTGQILFDSKESVMMREKINIYRQYANLLFNNPDAPFAFENDGTGLDSDYPTSTKIFDAVVFINIKRLFARDGIRKETFAMRLYKNAAASVNNSNLDITSEIGNYIIADLGANNDVKSAKNTGLSFYWLKDASDTSKIVGMLFYEAGIVVLNLGTSSVLGNTIQTARDVGTGGYSTSDVILSASLAPTDQIDGLIDGISDTGIVGIGSNAGGGSNGPGIYGNATFYPDLLVSSSIDNIVDHICGTRFSSGSLTALAFQNKTQINSSLLFCRAGVDQWNGSNNPTWSDSLSSLDRDEKFTYITTIGLVDSEGDLVGVAKLNRPVEKNETEEISFRIRLDF